MGEERLKEIMAAVLDDEDCKNLICGLPYEKAIQSKDTNGLYDYCEKTGVFKWKRGAIERRRKEELLELYWKIKTAGIQNSTESKAEVLDNSQEKHCFFKCQKCSYNRISKEDVFCPSCGRKLLFDKAPKVKPGVYVKYESVAQ